jgi:hypothetical protein
MTPQEFINLLQTKTFVVNKSMAIAQACIESGFGKHSFHNNIYGIKCHKGVKCMDAKTKEVVNGEYKDFKLAFAVYDSIDDCIADYNRIMSLPRYKPVREAKDYKEACYQVKKCGYATGKLYDINLIKLIEEYKLMEIYLTPNFKLSEFACKDGTPVPDFLIDNIKLVATELQKVRDYYGKPIRINSGYRTKEWNDKVGGSPKSYHLVCLAADTKPMWQISIDEYYKKVKELTNFKGYGISLNFLHTDLRKDYQVWIY